MTISEDFPIEPLPFAMVEYQDRLKAVRRNMANSGLDVLLVTGPENMFYLTGYRTTGYYVFQALIVPQNGDLHFVVRQLEYSNVVGRSWAKNGTSVPDTDSILSATADALARIAGTGRVRIGFEDRGYFLPSAPVEELKARLPNAAFVSSDMAVEVCRVLKSPQEIAYIRTAQRYTERGIIDGIAAIEVGRSENLVAAAVYAGMISAGSEYMASHPYVVAGKRSALAHATFERGSISTGDIVFFEVSGCHQRYAGPLMRTVSVGTPSRELQRTADVLSATLDAIIGAVRPGATSGEIDRAGRSIVEAAGLGRHWHHRTGYSVGLGFPPGWGEGHIMDLKPNDPRRVEAGMAFHVVPQLLLPGIGSVGFSETFVVTTAGAEVISALPRSLRTV